MAQTVNSKLLILFGIICGTFIFAESGFCADFVINNKSSKFSTILTRDTDSADTGDSALAEQIRAQRAARDNADARNAVTRQTKSGTSSNNCDTALRNCIQSKCGADYKNCETDSDTTFSDKLESCKKNTTCTAHEFNAFTPEIKEDKKQAIRLSLYNQTVDCGYRYNVCITNECGTNFDKCLSKSAGDKALAKCKPIATECTQADSGLAGRIGSVFGTVRVNAEKQIKADEKKLQTLRDQMQKSCQGLGAMFDNRSFDCVFTVSLINKEDSSIMASKKLYAGYPFKCSPDWFGIDVTTFRENAYRATRAQTAASSAMLGTGIGTAVGAFTSGAVSRMIQSEKAENALEDACSKNGQVLDNGKCRDMTDEEKCKASGKKWDNNKCVEKTAAELKKEATKKCTDSGGTYANNKCSCSKDKGLTNQDDSICKCTDTWKEYSKKDKKCIYQKSTVSLACPKIATYDKEKGCACPQGYNTSYGIGGAKPFDCVPNNEQTCKTANGTWRDTCYCGETRWSYGDDCSKKTPKVSTPNIPSIESKKGL